MQYLCLVYGEEEALDGVSDAEWRAHGEALRGSGHYVAAETLESVQTATTVRVRNGRLFLHDGPCTETKEPLAGFILIEAKDLNDAIRVAAKLPAARVGSVEVRPVRALHAP